MEQPQTFDLSQYRDNPPPAVEPPWGAYRLDYFAYLGQMPQSPKTPAEARTVAVTEAWRKLRVPPYTAARWATMGVLPTPAVARWVLDGVTPELYAECVEPIRAAWQVALDSPAGQDREWARRFIEGLRGPA